MFGVLELTLAASEKDSYWDEKGVQCPSTTTAMKASGRGGLQRTDRAVTTCYLPLRYRGVEHTFQLTLSSDTTFVLDVRIYLEAFKRNTPQPIELT